MNTEQLKKYHRALSEAGSISGAAKLMNMEVNNVKDAIRNNPELQSYLRNAEPPSELETMARKAIFKAFDDEENALVEKRLELDRQVAKGFEAIGVTGDALTEAMAFRNFGKFHFADMRQYIGGGVAKLFADLMAEIKVVRKEIEAAPINDVDTQRMLREDRSRLVKHTIDVYDRVREAALTAAVIESKRVEAQQKGVKGKPGFGCLTAPTVAMKVEGNVTVQQTSAPDSNPKEAAHQL
jgi:hypothetical protein